MRYKQVDLKREKLEMSPVYSTAFEHDGHTLGYIRLVNFSQHAAADMRKAITRLQVRCQTPPVDTRCSHAAKRVSRSFSRSWMSFERRLLLLLNVAGLRVGLAAIKAVASPKAHTVTSATCSHELICGACSWSQGEGAQGYILDLRSNPGGLVRAGLDVARLWLDGEDVPVFNVRALAARAFLSHWPHSLGTGPCAGLVPMEQPC